MTAVRDGLAYFFRGTWEDYQFPAFSPVHGLLLAFALAGILAIVHFRDALRRDDRRVLKKALLAGLLLEQVSQYGWYYLAGTFTLGDGLPLYICRTAILALILALVTDHGLIKGLAVYWGTFGGLLALLYPVIYPMHFPHITNFTYFGGHSIMVWTVAYLLAVEAIELTRRGLVFSLIFTNGFNLAVFFLNPYLNGNYSYFQFSPILPEVFARLPRMVYIIMVFALYNLLILLIHWVFSRRRDRRIRPAKPPSSH